jgi:hypothetical protein
MLSAGKDRNAVVTDANNAEIFGSNCDFYLNKGRISYVIISLPASWPTLIKRTRNIVISMPRHSFNKPYSLTIVAKAFQVLL